MRDRSIALIKVMGICLVLGLILASCGEGTAITGPGEAIPVEGAGGEMVPLISLPPLNPGETPSQAYVWGGPFWMGSPAGDPLALPDEMPMHEVVVEGFWIMTKEVTNGQYQQCVTDGACDPPILEATGVSWGQYGDPEYANRPVVGVNYDQAQNYCAHLGGRLPTEAEWEKGARGVLGWTYPWGEGEPNCDIATFAGCSSDGATDIFEHPGATGPWGLWGMAGNVAEWVSDWYSPTYYEISPMYYPQGPGPTGLKSVRGGSYLNDINGIRAAAREGLDPALGYEDVGFRCVPVTRQVAPMCGNTYIPFCTPTRLTTDDGDQPRIPCETGQPGPDEPLTGDQVTPTGDTGCTEDNTPIVFVDVGTGDANGYSVAIGDQICDCVVMPDSPGTLSCQCPGVESGMTIDLNVCQGLPQATIVAVPTTNETTVSLDSRLASMRQDIPVNLSSLYTATTAGDDCPDGYIYNPNTYQCELDPTGDDCPEGWAVTAVTASCQPTDEGSCPPGTTFSANMQGCTPDDGSNCPDQYFMTNLGTCEPDNNNNGDFCPIGYYYNRMIGCCSPLRGDNYGCPENFTYNLRTQNCIPNNYDGCPYGYFFDPYMGCVPNNGNTPDGGSTNPDPNNYEGDCPPGTALVATNQCGPTGDNPDNPYNTPNGDCQQGEYRDQNGDCVPYNDGQGDCPPGTATSAYTPNCTQTDDNGCRQGYFYNPSTQQCEPTNGPGSPCPNGYAFNFRMNCCTPRPGNDGSECPDGSTDGQTGDQTGTQVPGTAATQSPTESPTGAGTPNDGQNGGQGSTAPYPGAVTGGDYNPFTGNCDPVDTGDCPPGYHYNDQRVCVPDDTTDGVNPCPPGYHPDTQGQFATAGPAQVVCVPDVTEDDYGNCPPGVATAAYTPGCPADDPGDCPPDGQSATFAYDSSTNNCVPTSDGNPQDNCPPGTYFDYTLGFCVARTDDCCHEGYYYDTQLGFCVPLQPGPDVPGTNPNGENCPLGMTWSPRGCIPVNQQCWVITLEVPTCYYSPCPPGQTWNALSGGCQGECPAEMEWNFQTGQCESPTHAPCSSWTTYDQCRAAGCQWDTGKSVCQ